MKQDKVYEVEMILGAVSDTYDSQGKIESRSERIVEREELLAILEKFKGKQEQVPPMYSAKKVAGKKLYELARQGVEIERKPCSIEIKTLELIDYQWPTLKLVVECSTGTYIRSLVHDIGQSLGVGAYMSALRRTSIGDFKIEQALRLEELAKDNWEGFLI
jgi:tRNA pseudouridine55 synthase